VVWAGTGTSDGVMTAGVWAKITIWAKSKNAEVKIVFFIGLFNNS
jgi:hypothetical protein